jgi:drug/metabolite transporter (DMT)-like permease
MLSGDMQTDKLGPNIIGIVCGCSAVVMWAAYLAFARAGVNAGLMPQDFLLLRYGVAGLVMLPWLLRAGLRNLGGVGWGRGLVLATFAGPIFVLLGTAGFLFAPLSHGAVIQPSTATLVTMLLGWLVLKEQVMPLRAAGTVLLVAGLAIIATRSVGGVATNPKAWVGDALFFVGGLFWVGFTLSLKKWSVDAVAATAAVSVISAGVVIPAFFVFEDMGRIEALTTTKLVAQLLAQGLGAGVLALIAYAKAVQLLGAARAALFPAAVPVCTLLVGIPITGETPAIPEAFGAILASIGLAIALGALDPILSRRRQRT